MRKISEERHAAASERFARLNGATKTVVEMLVPFQSQLNDLKIALANDLNASGIGALGPIMSKVDTDAAVLKSRIAAAVQEMTSTAVILSPSGTEQK